MYILYTIHGSLIECVFFFDLFRYVIRCFCHTILVKHWTNQKQIFNAKQFGWKHVVATRSHLFGVCCRMDMDRIYGKKCACIYFILFYFNIDNNTTTKMLTYFNFTFRQHTWNLSKQRVSMDSISLAYMWNMFQ